MRKGLTSIYVDDQDQAEWFYTKVPHPGLMPRLARGRRGSRAWRRSAAATLTGPAQLSTPIARFPKTAIPGHPPVLIIAREGQTRHL
jgi:hypothetical protein